MQDTEFVISKYGDMLFRLSLVQLKNTADAEDAVQEVFLTYIKKHPAHKSEEHRKAWLIRVCANKCHDIQRKNKLRCHQSIDEIGEEYSMQDTDKGIISALMSLPEKYSRAMMLYYVEGYSVKEIAGIIGRTESAVKMRLKKGRDLFKTLLEENT